ncbi:hypothetical protein IKP85_04545 [bacterium]|nr:hypothetical protein [bacterium]
MEMGLAPITEDEFFRLTMAGTQTIKAKKEHTIKKGESLWKIAQDELGKNAKPAEILEYTYQIAKLNNKTTKKAMNSLKVNDKILLPEHTVKTKTDNSQQSQNPQAKQQPAVPTQQIKPKAQPTAENTHQSYIQAQAGVTLPLLNWNNVPYTLDWSIQQNITVPYAPAGQAAVKPVSKPATVKKPAATTVKKPKPQEKPKSNAEAGFDIIKSAIINTDKNLLVSTCGFRGYDINCYTIYKYVGSQRKQLVTYTTDQNGNVISIAFNGKKDEMALRYDYDISSNGQITQSDEYNITTKNIQKLNAKSLTQLNAILKEKALDANKRHESLIQ